MTHKIQISKKLPDGTILVIGGDTPDEFHEHVDEMVNSMGARHIKNLFDRFAETGEEIEEPVTATRPQMLGERRLYH